MVVTEHKYLRSHQYTIADSDIMRQMALRTDTAVITYLYT